MANIRRNIGKFFETPKCLLYTIAAGALGLPAAAYTSDEVFKDDQIQVADQISAPAVKTLNAQIKKVENQRAIYNQLSNKYYSNLYGDKKLADDAFKEMGKIDKQIRQNMLGILTNLYLNPNFDGADYTRFSEKIETLDLPTEISLESGNSYDITPVAPDAYKTCQINVQHAFENASTPINKVLDMHRCQIENNGLDGGDLGGLGLLGSIFGLLSGLGLAVVTSHTGWENLPKKEKKPKQKPLES